MESWIGPGTTQSSVQVVGLLSGAHDPATNTFLFTSHQAIGLTLGPEDLSGVAGGADLVAGAEREVEFGNRPSEYACSLGMRFITLYAKHWPEMIAVLGSQPLSAVLANRENFGVPYETIDHVEVKRIVNPGLRFHLTDGTSLRFMTLQLEQMAKAADFLRQHVSVK